MRRPDASRQKQNRRRREKAGARHLSAFPNQAFRDIVAEGTADRLRAILLTTVSTVAGLLPLAYGFGGADPYMGPMALALGWGLLFATPLTLILVPSVFLIGNDIGRLFQRSSPAE